MRKMPNNLKPDMLTKESKQIQSRLDRIEKSLAHLSNSTQKISKPGFARRIMKLGSYVLAALTTFLSIYTGINASRFDISIDAYGTLDSKDAFQTRFVLTNQGPYAIHDIRYICTFSHIETNSSPNPLSRGPGIDVDKTVIRELLSHGKRSLHCSNPLMAGKDVKTGAIIEIDVSYRPSYWLWRRHGLASFGLLRDNEGNVLWIPLENL